MCVNLKMLCCQVEILHLKDCKLHQILCVDKTCFLRPGHLYRISKPTMEEIGATNPGC